MNAPGEAGKARQASRQADRRGIRRARARRTDDEALSQDDGTPCRVSRAGLMPTLL